MRIFIADTYYPDFLADFYQKHPRLTTASYNKQKQALLFVQFGLADFYSKNFKKLGHQAEEFIVNNEILQKQWARQHHVKYEKFKHIPRLRNYYLDYWKEAIVRAQIIDFKPDVIYLHNLTYFSQKFLKSLKKLCHLLVAQIAYPVSDYSNLREIDLVISAAPGFIKKFAKAGIKVEYLKLAFEPTILSKLHQTKPKYDIVFIGGFTPHHRDGTRLFEQVAAKVKVDFWGYGNNYLKSDSPILKSFHGPAWGLAMYQILAAAKIVINRHVKEATKYAGNMRLFESTGIAAMLITDYKDNLDEFFEIGKEIEVYRNPRELIQKIKYYLKHDSKRKKIAQAGQKRTLRDHSYAERVKQLSTILQENLDEVSYH